jgi:large subunit ribosomal protein L27
MAHKKAAWSTKNLKDSKPKYRGVKVFGWQTVSAWNIIIRQKGNKFECGKNVYMWRDFTILSAIAWIVSFKKKNIKRFDGRTYLKTVVEVFPADVSKKTTKSIKKVSSEKLSVDTKTSAKKTVVKKDSNEDKQLVEKKVVTKKIVKQDSPKKETVKKSSVKKSAAKKVSPKK